jgi:hypothetical protein
MLGNTRKDGGMEYLAGNDGESGLALKVGRGGEIRTPDLVFPKHAR